MGLGNLSAFDMINLESDKIIIIQRLLEIDLVYTKSI